MVGLRLGRFINMARKESVRNKATSGIKTLLWEGNNDSWVLVVETKKKTSIHSHSGDGLRAIVFVSE